ncbi:rod shape-determining protein RodA [Candidatus Dojkabacteria bacterium]|uniref:Rod shape-determining protein RodA n=1 Tax=Candidatus Dojkabacteria bacterium TaxID=2099670 RepID=A0A955I6F6_9BACT|nr:rod shape-determining protein RodA [Candidatus Dojkabacteria bacterium]
MFIRSKLRHQNPVIVLLIVILAILGLTNVFSTTFVQGQGVSPDFWDQVIFWILGAFIYLVVSTLDTRMFQELKIQIALFVIILVGLIAVLFVGDVVNGTRRWLSLGAFTLQPSEFAKLVIITFTASVFTTNRQIILTHLKKLSRKKEKVRKSLMLSLRENWRVLLNILIVIISVFLTWKQPSLGNAIIMFSIWGLMLMSFVPRPRQVYSGILVVLIGLNLSMQIVNFSGIYNGFDLSFAGIDLGLAAVSLILVLIIGKFARIKPLILVIALVCGVLLANMASFGWAHLLSPYQQSRITAYLNPESDPLGSYWQVEQSKIAIASGQILGKGFLQGTQSSTGLLPFPQTDFAYAAFTEQFGLVGSMFMLGTYYLLIITILKAGDIQKENFGRALCTGVAIMFALNIIINVGMNLGLMPVTGVPLPLISYGGSSVFVNLIGLGLVQMVYSQPQIKTKSR